MSNIKADSAQALLPSLETQEKRCAPRRPISCFIVVNFFRQRIVAKCIDYSRDGFGAIIRGCDLPLEWIVTIELPMHGKKPLKVQARPIQRKSDDVTEHLRASSSRSADGCRRNEPYCGNNYDGGAEIRKELDGISPAQLFPAHVAKLQPGHD